MGNSKPMHSRNEKSRFRILEKKKNQMSRLRLDLFENTLKKLTNESKEVDLGLGRQKLKPMKIVVWDMDIRQRLTCQLKMVFILTMT